MSTRVIAKVILSRFQHWLHDVSSIIFIINFCALINKNEERPPGFLNSIPDYDGGWFHCPIHVFLFIRNFFDISSNDPVISLIMSKFNCENLLIWPNNLTHHARPEFLQKNFASLQSFLLYSCWQSFSLLEGERGHFQVFVDELSHGSGTHVNRLCHLSHGSPWVSPNPLANALNHWFRLPLLGWLDKSPFSKSILQLKVSLQ